MVSADKAPIPQIFATCSVIRTGLAECRLKMPR
jgi:hypothetical protein